MIMISRILLLVNINELQYSLRLTKVAIAFPSPSVLQRARADARHEGQDAEDALFGVSGGLLLLLLLLSVHNNTLQLFIDWLQRALYDLGMAH
jgi:hypothetical protein